MPESNEQNTSLVSVKINDVPREVRALFNRVCKLSEGDDKSRAEVFSEMVIGIAKEKFGDKYVQRAITNHYENE